jgi:DNA-binding response OmpR family regulator
MNQTVLLVKDDREMLLDLKDALQDQSETVFLLLAANRVEALQILRHQPISVVVSEVKPPRMDGLDLLAAVRRTYPYIPVVIIADGSTPELEKLVRKGGAAGFMVKPFPMVRLAKQISTLLLKENEGGVLHGISSAAFLQLVEAEQKTCTIRVEETATGKRGLLFFVEGSLCDARQGDLNGKAAAYEIFGWEPVSFWIQNDSVVRHNRIQKDVHLLILEVARRRDENQNPATMPTPDAGPCVGERQTGQVALLKSKIEQGLGRRGGIEKIFNQDPVWNERVRRLAHLSRKLNLGRLLTGYIDQGDPHAYILAGGETPAVLVVSRKCPREKLMRILADH